MSKKIATKILEQRQVVQLVNRAIKRAATLSALPAGVSPQIKPTAPAVQAPPRPQFNPTFIAAAPGGQPTSGSIAPAVSRATPPKTIQPQDVKLPDQQIDPFAYKQAPNLNAHTPRIARTENANALTNPETNVDAPDYQHTLHRQQLDTYNRYLSTADAMKRKQLGDSWAATLGETGRGIGENVIHPAANGIGSWMRDGYTGIRGSLSRLGGLGTNAAQGVTNLASIMAPDENNRQYYADAAKDLGQTAEQYHNAADLSLQKLLHGHSLAQPSPVMHTGHDGQPIAGSVINPVNEAWHGALDRMNPADRQSPLAHGSEIAYGVGDAASKALPAAAGMSWLYNPAIAPGLNLATAATTAGGLYGAAQGANQISTVNNLQMPTDVPADQNARAHSDAYAAAGSGLFDNTLNHALQGNFLANAGMSIGTLGRAVKNWAFPARSAAGAAAASAAVPGAAPAAASAAQQASPSVLGAGGQFAGNAAGGMAMQHVMSVPDAIAENDQQVQGGAAKTVYPDQFPDETPQEANYAPDAETDSAETQPDQAPATTDQVVQPSRLMGSITADQISQALPEESRAAWGRLKPEDQQKVTTTLNDRQSAQKLEEALADPKKMAAMLEEAKPAFAEQAAQEFAVQNPLPPNADPRAAGARSATMAEHVKQSWNNLGQWGQLAFYIGIPLGLIGLMAGGLPGIMMAAAGLGAAGVAGATSGMFGQDAQNTAGDLVGGLNTLVGNDMTPPAPPVKPTAEQLAAMPAAVAAPKELDPHVQTAKNLAQSAANGKYSPQNIEEMKQLGGLPPDQLLAIYNAMDPTERHQLKQTINNTSAELNEFRKKYRGEDPSDFALALKLRAPGSVKGLLPAFSNIEAALAQADK